MEIRLGKPVVNNFKVCKWQNEKPRRGVLREKLYLDLHFVYRKH